MNVILSIKPEFIEKIFSGEKRYEYRKIPEIISDTPANIWKQTRDHSSVSKSFWKKDYAGKDKGVALKIKECKKYKNAVDPNTIVPNFKVPQSFFIRVWLYSFCDVIHRFKSLCISKRYARR